MQNSHNSVNFVYVLFISECLLCLLGVQVCSTASLQPRKGHQPPSRSAQRRRASRGAACTAPPASSRTSSRSTRAGGRSSRCSSSSSSSSPPAGVPGTTALLQKIFFTESFRYFPQILSNIFFVQVPDSHDRVGGADPGLGVQCHPTILLLLTYCKAPSRHTRNAQSYYLQVTCVNICRQY